MRKLNDLQAEHDLVAEPVAGYTVRQAIDDWLAGGLEGPVRAGDLAGMPDVRCQAVPGGGSAEDLAHRVDVAAGQAASGELRHAIPAACRRYVRHHRLRSVPWCRRRMLRLSAWWAFRQPDGYDLEAVDLLEV